MANLLGAFKGMMTDGVISKISSLIGSNSSMTKAALGSLGPSMLKGIIDKGSTVSGAQSLLDTIKGSSISESKFGNLSSLLDNDSGDLMSAGAKMSDSLFGSSAKSMTSGLGIGGDSSSKLMSLATPLFMNALGGIVKKDNLDAAGLKNYLGSQKSHILQATKTATTQHATRERSGGGMMKWLIPLFLFLAAAWFFMQHLNEDKTAEGTTVTTTETATSSTADNTIKTASETTASTGTITNSGSTGEATTSTTTNTTETSSGPAYSVDADGNLINAEGNIIYKKGEFTIENGAYLDAEGKKIGFMKKVGNAIGDAAGAVGGAVGDAAGAVGGAVGDVASKTADAFKDVFGGMFKKKTSGEAVATYGLNNIEFDENNKVVNFSKNEVLGLAAALKAYPDSKIKVQVSGADKKTSKTRAKIVHDWLVTLGIADKQVSAEGLEEGADNVSIVVE